jgi:hypothetical protein
MDFFDKLVYVAMEADDLSADLKNIQKIGNAKLTGAPQDNATNTQVSNTKAAPKAAAKAPAPGNTNNKPVDITKDTQKAVKKLKNISDDNPDENDTDDNLDNEDDNTDDNTDNEDENDEGSDDNEDNPDDETAGEEDAPQDDIEKHSMAKVKKNMFLLYTIMKNNLEALSDHEPPIKEDAVEVFTCVKENLRQAKDLIHNIIVDDINNYTYEELLKNYEAIKMVYDICLEILESYFNDILSDNEDKKDKKGKESKATKANKELDNVNDRKNVKK